MYDKTTNLLLVDKNDSLAAILADVDNLMSDTDYDDDFVKPKEAAYSRIRALLQDSNVFVMGRFPLGAAFPDGDGGLGVEWVDGTKKIVLSVAQGEQGSASLYFRWNGNEYGTIFDITPEILSERLNQFNGNERE